MARWLLVLLLTVSVGIGVVGACPEGRCADAPVAAAEPRGAEHEGADDDCADDDCADDCADHDAPHGESDCETCPPQCAGCRVSALAPWSAIRIDRALAAAIVPTEPTATPIPAPPPHGLFRPPRA